MKMTPGCAKKESMNDSLTSARPWVVYGLRLDGETEYRYVGQTSKKPTQRLYLHVWDSRKEQPKFPVHKWIKAKGEHRIVLDILEAVEPGDGQALNAAEIVWIASLRAAGHRLLNITDGGEGTRGYRGTPETREAQSKRMSGENNPRFGSTWTPELREKIIASMPDQSGANSPRFGKSNTSEHRKRISESHHDVAGENNPFFQKQHSDETRAKMAQAWADRTPEELVKMLERRKRTIETLDPSVMEGVRKKLSETAKRTMAENPGSLTDAALQAHLRRTPEEVTEIVAKRQATLAARTDEERAETRKRRVSAWTPEKKAAHSAQAKLRAATRRHQNHTEVTPNCQLCNEGKNA